MHSQQSIWSHLFSEMKHWVTGWKIYKVLLQPLCLQMHSPITLSLTAFNEENDISLLTKVEILCKIFLNKACKNYRKSRLVQSASFPKRKKIRLVLHPFAYAISCLISRCYGLHQTIIYSVEVVRIVSSVKHW